VPTINPAATDIVGDGVDQNCDGIDGTDADGDGHASLVSGGDDCDDAEPSVSPSMSEICGNGVDDDCLDGDRLPETGYLDLDGDGYGDPLTELVDCGLGTDYIADGTDCDDGAADVYPGATETCDGRDEDCANGPDDPFGADCRCSLLDPSGCLASPDCRPSMAWHPKWQPAPEVCHDGATTPLDDLSEYECVTEVFGSCLLSYEYALSDVTYQPALLDLAVVESAGQLTVEGTSLVSVNSATEPFDLFVAGEPTGVPFSAQCDGWIEPFEVTFEATLGLEHRPGLTATTSPPTWSWDLTGDDLVLVGCDAAAVDEVLSFFGYDLIELIIDSLEPSLEAEWIEGRLAETRASLEATAPWSNDEVCVPAACPSELGWRVDGDGDCVWADTSCLPYEGTACAPDDLVATEPATCP